MGHETTPCTEEPVYSRSVFEDLIACCGPDEFADGRLLISDKGVHVDDLNTGLEWHPKSDAMLPGSANAMDEPWLPFPFTARLLAAWLFDGWGSLVRDFYGEWADGPDPDALARLPSRAIKAREVLKSAYAACREAIALAPVLDPELERAAQALAKRWDTANDEANRREGVYEPHIPSSEYSMRRARARKSSESLSERQAAARAEADMAYARWRMAVVQHLLLPVHQVADEAFRSEVLKSLPPQRREEALYQLRAYGDFEDTSARSERWRLLCKRTDLGAELRRWNQLAVVSASDAMAQDQKLDALRAELASVEAQLSRRTEEDVLRGAVGIEDRGERQRRRLKDFRGFGGELTRAGSKWVVQDRQRGAFRLLAEQEKFNQSQNASPKSIRKDLHEAADAEEANRRSAAPQRRTWFP